MIRGKKGGGGYQGVGGGELGGKGETRVRDALKRAVHQEVLVPKGGGKREKTSPPDSFEKGAADPSGEKGLWGLRGLRRERKLSPGGISGKGGKE